jgi:hypothetical protein
VDDTGVSLAMNHRIPFCVLLFAAATAASVGAQTPAPDLPAVPAPAAAPAGPPPSIEQVMARATAYVKGYEKDFAGIVAEEKYDQISRLGGRFDQFGSMHHDAEKRRVFRSDLLLVKPEGSQSWVQFRDVFEVDGKLVRDRNDRLAKLFLSPDAAMAKQVQRIKAESARYNVGSIQRDMNIPVFALYVLKEQYQYRFLFNHIEADDAGRQDGAWAVDYREVGTGTLIRTNNEADLPIEGRLWIDPATGRVVETIMRMQSKLLKGSIQVEYGTEPSLAMLVPRSMHEEYRQFTDGGGVTAVATYSNYRRFQVKVDEQMAPSKP